jgi:SAM-dependent methyltransferase
MSLGNVTTIQAADESFDAVFDFGVIHHVPAWEDAIREVRRVLEPGGIFVFEEVSKQALDRWIYRALFEHPKENRFTAENFVADTGEPRNRSRQRQAGQLFLGDFFAGVGRRDRFLDAKCGGKPFLSFHDSHQSP